MNNTRNGNSHAPQSLTRDILMVFAVTAALLTVPLLGVLLSDEMNWGLEDFVFAGVLFAGTGLAYVFGSRLFHTRNQRIILGAVLGFVLLTIWVEAAVGIFH